MFPFKILAPTVSKGPDIKTGVRLIREKHGEGPRLSSAVTPATPAQLRSWPEFELPGHPFGRVASPMRKNMATFPGKLVVTLSFFPVSE